MRLFAGVDVPAPKIRGLPPGNPDNPSHLTMLFFGEVAEDAVDGLSGRLKDAIAPFSPFELDLRGLGIFPSAQRPRILWAGVGRGADDLTRLHAAMRSAAGPLAPAEERPFVPHLTILRVRGRGDADRALEALRQTPSVSLGSTRIAEVQLKSSILAREGAAHHVLVRFPLAGGAPAPRTGDPPAVVEGG